MTDDSSSKPTSADDDSSASSSSSSRTIKVGSQRPTDQVHAEPPKPKPVHPAAPPATPPAESMFDDRPRESMPSLAETEGHAERPIRPEPTDRPTIPTRLQRISAELQDEIDQALGDVSLDDLLGGGTASNSAAGEVTVDERRSARVIKLDRESVFFDLGGQAEGIASLRQFAENPDVGTSIEVIVTRYLPDENLYEVMVPGASVEVQDWSDLAEGVIVEARITGHNQGGLECEVQQIRGFIPISQVSLFRVEDLEPYHGQSLRCVVTEANPERRNLVLSHRAVLEREKQEAREKLIGELEVGQIREGTVQRIQDFGAFVDLGGIDGLVHVSQLSWDRIKHPSEVVEEGQKIRVRIEKIDPVTGKIGLSYRDLLEHPWEHAASNFPVGAIVEGVVVKLMEFGAFVRVAPGVEGLVHISELAHHRVTRVNSVVREGEKVQVKVLSVDSAAQRMSLSIKAAQAAPTVAEAEPTESPEDQATNEELQKLRQRPNAPLKGGLGRNTGGDQFGLKW